MAAKTKEQRYAERRLPEAREALALAKAKGNRSAVVLFTKVVNGLETVAKGC